MKGTKMKAMRISTLCFATALTIPICAAQTQDAKGCKDSPLIARFPGTTIYECKDSADDAYNFPGIGPKGEDKQLEGGVSLHCVQHSTRC
jgi:hypothetical protein